MPQSPLRRGLLAGALVSSSALALSLTLVPATAGSANDLAQARTDRVSPTKGVMQHLKKFEAIGDEHGSRASGTPGYAASRDYVVSKLEKAGYEPEVQSFMFDYFEQVSPTVFERTAPTPASYEEGEDFGLMEYSGSGDVTAPVQPVDLSLGDPGASTSGCEAADFAGFTSGNIALVQRGTCTFATKVVNAQDAGAAGVVIMNQGTEGRTGAFSGTLGGAVGTVPSVGTSFAIGQDLTADGTEVHLASETYSEARETWNVLAETKGSKKNVVMAGAHLDSVPEGNGVNDNGSGSGALLEVAERMGKATQGKHKPNNRVRFAWWGAEEAGLVGSEHYVADLVDTKPGKFNNIALYLNFDMVGSPNYALMVYDGDNSAYPVGPGSEEGPEGSDAIERMFHRFFDDFGTGSDETAFSGRSDYGPFIAQNVPAGGLFTGAEGVKTEEQAAQFGGTAGEAYDPCYHAACDDLTNVSRRAIRANTAAIGHAVAKYARSTRSVNGDGTGHQPPPEEEPRGHRSHHRHAGDPVAR